MIISTFDKNKIESSFLRRNRRYVISFSVPCSAYIYVLYTYALQYMYMACNIRTHSQLSLREIGACISLSFSSFFFIFLSFRTQTLRFLCTFFSMLVRVKRFMHAICERACSSSISISSSNSKAKIKLIHRQTELSRHKGITKEDDTTKVLVVANEPARGTLRFASTQRDHERSADSFVQVADTREKRALPFSINISLRSGTSPTSSNESIVSF